MNQRVNIAYEPRVSIGVAAAVVLVFSVVSLAFGIERMSRPNAQTVLVGAIAAAVTVTLVRPALAKRTRIGARGRRVRQILRRESEQPNQSDAAEAGRLLALAIKGALEADGVAVAIGSESVDEGGVIEPSVGGTELVHQGEVVAGVSIYRRTGLDTAESDLLETLALSVGPAIANVVWVDRLHAKVAEIESVVREIEASHRRLVEAEYEGRRRVAREVTEFLDPVFARMRHLCDLGDLDLLAAECEGLIETLRSFSRVVLEDPA